MFINAVGKYGFSNIFSRGEKTLHQPPKNVFFSPTYLESWKCLENSFCCSHCEIWAERDHLRPSLSAILDFPPSQGGVRKTLHMLCLLYSLSFHMKADTLYIILMYNLLKSIHTEQSYGR